MTAQPLEGAGWEWVNLAGTEEILASAGVDTTPEHRLGEAAAVEERELRDRLAADPSTYRRLDDLVIALEAARVTEQINDTCRTLQVDPIELFIDGAPHRTREFVRGVPVLNMLSQLRLHRLRNFQHPIEQHDGTDMAALSTAIPYCDIVATERRWVHAIHAAHLDTRYKTRMISSVAALDDELSRV